MDARLYLQPHLIKFSNNKNITMYQVDNLSIIDTIVDLQSRGFCYDFCFVNDRLFCAQQKAIPKRR
ncbi:hypothetical protein BH11BAC5_BH11BAC5_11390 [soil metagenome]